MKLTITRTAMGRVTASIDIENAENEVQRKAGYNLFDRVDADLDAYIKERQKRFATSSKSKTKKKKRTSPELDEKEKGEIE